MGDLLNCLIFLALIGIASFFLGRLLPKTWFSYDQFPYRPFVFEQKGNLYTKIGVRRWKERFPDMSVILPSLIPSKRLPPHITVAQVEQMIQETCVAEWIHKLLAVAGFGCVWVWKGLGGWIVALLYALGNFPYIIIQRYNRPKLVRLFQRLRAKEAGRTNQKQENTRGKGTDTELQYGAGPQFLRSGDKRIF